MRTYLTGKQIQERIKALPRNPKYLSIVQIRQRIQEFAITNPPKRPKNDLQG